jgi:tRNA-dihydrouridine synthase A
MAVYLARMAARGVAPRAVAGHMMGLYQGLPGARRWRRTLGDPAALEREGANILRAAAAPVAR